MKVYDFVMRIEGSAKGTVKANSKKEAERTIREGQWDDIDIDIEEVIEIEHLIDKKRCATCEYWIEKYQECEHPYQEEYSTGAYMSPPNGYCELWEQNC